MRGTRGRKSSNPPSAVIMPGSTNAPGTTFNHQNSNQMIPSSDLGPTGGHNTTPFQSEFPSATEGKRTLSRQEEEKMNY